MRLIVSRDIRDIQFEYLFQQAAGKTVFRSNLLIPVGGWELFNMKQASFQLKGKRSGVRFVLNQQVQNRT